MSAALWKETEGSDEVVTDLITGKFQHSQQVFTHCKVWCTQFISGWVPRTHGRVCEADVVWALGTLTADQLGLPSRTGSPTKEKLLEVDSKLHRKETIEMKERQSYIKIGEGLRTSWLQASSATSGEKEGVLSSHAFHVVIRESFSEKCSSRWICGSHQPELGHTPMPEPVTAFED